MIKIRATIMEGCSRSGLVRFWGELPTEPNQSVHVFYHPFGFLQVGKPNHGLLVQISYEIKLIQNNENVK